MCNSFKPSEQDLFVRTSILIKSIIASLLDIIGGVTWKLRRVSKCNYAILMYHRVVSRDQTSGLIQPGMYVEPVTFERHIRFLKKYFVIVPISAILSDYEKASNTFGAKPRCVFTFDDGWYDFSKYVFPILKSYQVPATVFLPTDFIGTEDWFWTDRLVFIFQQRYNSKNNQSIGQGSNPLVNKLISLQGSFETILESAIALLKTYPNEEIEKAITELSSVWGIAPNPSGRAFLSWEEVREMVESGLVTFGSHTASHRLLTTLKERDVSSELRKSREKLISENVVDPAFIPFSYPNGNYTDRIAGMVKDAGYGLAITTENGWNHSRSDPFALRRISIHQDMTSTEAMLGCRIVGIL